jgi:EAL domain-containing protein (putative c-di-GMP-specific phosphodiesterase class I)
VVLLDDAEPGKARSFDHLSGSRSASPAPRAITIDAERLREAHELSPSVDLHAVGVETSEFLAPLAASGAQAFRVCPLEYDEQVRGFLCVGFVVDAHGQEDAGINANEIAERLSLALARATPAAAAGEWVVEQPRQRSPLESGLHRALQREEFTLVYQPIISSHSRHVLAVEALVRWPNGADGTSRSAAEFVPVAEDSGLIVDLGDWVLRTACSQFDAWRREGVQLDFISVNVSPRQLRHSGLLATILACLQRSGMEPRQLQIEITEDLMKEGPAAVAMLRELAQRGVRLALDDFGDGNSRLSAVRDLPVTALKIDRSCVAGIAESEQVRDLVRAVVGMGAATGKLVIAEGVESPEQMRLLEMAGCDAMQGYLFAAPLAAADVPGFMLASPRTMSLVA